MSAPLVLGTAGHVDHGKTALVGALTGHDTDRLAAEKSRGISIELGFAPLRLASGRLVSLIDVPGHERFVRHMVAGATGVDGFVLCVAADDGVMPQTREHLAVLDLLGIDRGVVAVTRSDVVDPARAIREVTPLVPPGTEIVAVCAPTGEGIDRLRAALERLAAGARTRLRDGPARLWVNRSFSVRGAGTVVTGTLWGGAIAVGDRVRTAPGGAAARVRGVQVHDVAVERAEGGRVALALAGIDRARVARGACLVREGDGWAPADRLAVTVTAVPGEVAAIRSGAVLQCFLGTHEGPATCVLLDRRRLEAGERGLAELRLADPVCARAGDRLVLRSSAHRTVAGAHVVDTAPPRRTPRRALHARLAVLAGGDAAAILALRAREAGPAGLDLPAGAAGGGLVVLGGRAFHPAVVAGAREAAVAAMGTAGAAAAAVRAATGLPGEAAQALVGTLVGEGAITPRGGRLVPPTAAPHDVPTRAEELAGLLASAGLRAPSADELARASGLGADALGAALAHLRTAGRAVRVGEMWFDAAALEDAWQAALPMLRERPVGIGELRDVWRVGRRHALAIAGHLDDRRLTRREGDARVLRRGTGATGLS